MQSAKLALAVLALGGCATVVPMQTASVVPARGYRLGAQVTVAPYCTLTGIPAQCLSAPDFPEVRAGGRYGVADRVDLGLSAWASASRFSGVTGGAFADAKLEAWSKELSPGRRALASVALGAGVSSGTGTYGVSAPTEVDLAVPAFFGYQVGALEWVGSVRAVERVKFVDVNADGRRDALSSVDLGIAVGFFFGRGIRWGAQLGYHATPELPASGPITLSLGVLFDVPGH